MKTNSQSNLCFKLLRAFCPPILLLGIYPKGKRNHYVPRFKHKNAYHIFIGIKKKNKTQ